MKVVGYIYEESDYSVFKKLEDNRILSSTRVKNLIESISKRNLMNPILVNSNMEILDGQGRFEAKKRLKLPIWYVIQEDGDIDDCILLNQFNKPWSVEDFVNTFANQGNENYIRLREVWSSTKAPISLICRLCNRSKQDRTDVIKAGILKFTDNDAETVKRCLAKANDISRALCFDRRHNNNFFVAVKVVIETEGYNHEEMLTKCEQGRTTFVQTGDLESQLKEFTRIYNRNRKANTRLYFEDYMRNRGHNVRTYETQKFDSTDRIDVSTLVGR